MERESSKKLIREAEEQVVTVESEYDPENPEGDDGIKVQCVVIRSS